MRERIDSLKQELNDLIGEYSERNEECDSEYKAAINKLVDLERKNMSLTQQYFRSKMKNTEEEQKIQE